MSERGDDLIIPVYLNQRMVFDLIAMLEDGISTVTKVVSSEESKQAEESKYGAEFGLGQALSSLLRIRVGGGHAEAAQGAKGKQQSEEKVHTPSSLLQKLRRILASQKKITYLDETGTQPEAGQIVEFSAPLRRNPLIEVMNAMISMLDIAIAFSDEPRRDKSKKGGLSADKRTKAQMEKFLEMLKAGGTLDLVGESLGSGYRTVITLEEEFLNDPSMSDLAEGTFQVLGKAIRVVPDSDQSISLIRKASLSIMEKGTLTKMFSEMEQGAAGSGINIPSLQWEIEGPVVQVVPIGIFA
ncbi:MAG: hypothetical protein GXP25_13145 [Planctomycetes bacterium]|nr:hypothetical protein [Planctomycetota bacterium]